MRRSFLLPTALAAILPSLTAAADTSVGGCQGWLSRKFYAAASSEDIKQCLEDGRRVEERTDRGETPLHLAVSADASTSVLLALLAGGADVSLTTSQNYTPLDTAAAEGNRSATISTLIASGSDPAATISPDTCRNPLRTCAETPLHLAAQRAGAVDIMAALIASGVEIDAFDAHYRTPLHLAAKEAGLDEIRLLLQAGADVEATDENNETPLHAVARRPDASLEVVSALLEAGASPDAKAAEDVTPLLLATAYTHSPQVFGRLLEGSSDPCFEDERGRSVLSLYERNDALEQDARYWDLHERCAE